MKVFLQFIAICIAILVIGDLVSHGEFGALITAVCAIIVGFALWIVNRRSESRAWTNRPKRLCTNCFAQAQPFRKDNGVLYCPHCQAENPVSLDSPAARQYLARVRV